MRSILASALVLFSVSANAQQPETIKDLPTALRAIDVVRQQRDQKIGQMLDELAGMRLGMSKLDEENVRLKKEIEDLKKKVPAEKKPE